VEVRLQPPRNGLVHVNPPSGIFGNTTFIVSATNFVYVALVHMWFLSNARCSRLLRMLHCLRFARDDEDTSLMFNYFVQPPGGVEYALLSAPAPLTSVIISTLPVGTSTVRAVAVDSRYARDLHEVRRAVL